MQDDVKIKGVCDIAFLIDCTMSMAPCIEAVKNNIYMFLDELSKPIDDLGTNLSDWRAAVFTYGDAHVDGQQWFSRNPFVRDMESVRSQIASIRMVNGGDEPESLLDALMILAKMPFSDASAQEGEPNSWRSHSVAARVVILITDASFKPEIVMYPGATLEDLKSALETSHIRLTGFVPRLPCFQDLSTLGDTFVEFVDVNPGETPVQAMARFTSDMSNFKNALKALAKTLTKSAVAKQLPLNL